MRPQSSMGLNAKCLQAQNTDKASCYSLIQARAMLAPTSKSPEEREFVVDSGASVHMLSKKDLSSGELETVWRSRNSTTVVTANGQSANKRESTSFCLQSCLLRDSANTR